MLGRYSQFEPDSRWEEVYYSGNELQDLRIHPLVSQDIYKETFLADIGVENELEIAILALFVDIKIRYRNLVVGKLDRANVKRAMEMGISAHQVSF
jgi:hypothetical protein